MKLKVTVNDVPYEVNVEVAEDEPQPVGAIVIGGPASAGAPAAGAGATGGGSSSVPAPLAGSVSRILVAVGDEVAAGAVLVVLEAMKMETEITSPKAGKVTKIHVEKGAAVQGGQPLVDVE